MARKTSAGSVTAEATQAVDEAVAAAIADAPLPPPDAPAALLAPPAATHATTTTATTTTKTATIMRNETMEKALKTAEEMVSFGQGNVEAVMKCGQIWAAGLQDIGKQFAASAQAQIDQTMATMKAMTQAKSLKEAIDLQSSHARAAVEKAMAETGKLTDASLKLAEQTMAPITARVTLAMERFGRAV